MTSLTGATYNEKSNGPSIEPCCSPETQRTVRDLSLLEPVRQDDIDFVFFSDFVCFSYFCGLWQINSLSLSQTERYHLAQTSTSTSASVTFTDLATSATRNRRAIVRQLNGSSIRSREVIVAETNTMFIAAVTSGL